MAPTHKQIAAGQRRTLKAMRARLLQMAAAWGELDEYNMHMFEEAAEKLLDVHASLIPDDEYTAFSNEL